MYRNDPTNPDLRAFSAHGEKLIIGRQGWADSGTSPFGMLKYYAAIQKRHPGVENTLNS